MGERITDEIELLERIGHGGMGQVYRARHGGLGAFEKKVAVKLMLRKAEADPTDEARFFREVTLLSKLDHANIMRVSSFGKSKGPLTQGQLFLECEFIDGRNLKQVIQDKGRISVGDACLIASKIAAALKHMHSPDPKSGRMNTVIHRDLTPHNVMITSDGAVKIIDFGVAQTSDADHTLTRTGVLVGKLPYVAPEIFSGKDFSAASDVYSLGVIFLELVTGVNPFKGTNDANTQALILAAGRDAIKSLLRKHKVGRELRKLVLGMLLHEPTGRPTAKSACDGLSRLAELADGRRESDLGALVGSLQAGADSAEADLTASDRKTDRNRLLIDVSPPRPLRPWLRPRRLAGAAVLLGAIAAGATFTADAPEKIRVSVPTQEAPSVASQPSAFPDLSPIAPAPKPAAGSGTAETALGSPEQPATNASPKPRRHRQEIAEIEPIDPVESPESPESGDSDVPAKQTSPHQTRPIDYSGIEGTVHAHLGDFNKYCDPQKMALNGRRPVGQMTVRLHVSPKGKLIEAKIDSAGNTLKSEPTEQCILKVIRQITFLPLSGGDDAEVPIPFNFPPQPAAKTRVKTKRS